jgi:hypothetical protein
MHRAAGLRRWLEALGYKPHLKAKDLYEGHLSSVRHFHAGAYSPAPCDAGAARENRSLSIDESAPA